MDGFDILFGYARDGLEQLGSAEGAGALAFLLALVLAWSASAKGRDPDSAARAISDFGVTNEPRRIYGVLLAGVEGVIAALLAVGPVTDIPVAYGAVAATVVLGGFSSMLAVAVSRGRRFPCSCFGASRSPLSWWTFARTLGLTGIALALTAAVLPHEPAAQPLDMIALQWVIAAGVLVCILLAGGITKLVRWNNDPFGTKAIRKASVT